MYRQSSNKTEITDASCPKCSCKRLLFIRGTIKCTDCGHIITKAQVGRKTSFVRNGNKYNAKRTEFNGKIYDSRFEASVASDLEFRKRAGDILDYEPQFRLEVDVCNSKGEIICHKRHKVDFKITNKDHSYTLSEAKGVITSDYQWRRDIVVGIWLSEHKDYDYQVITQKNYRK